MNLEEKYFEYLNQNLDSPKYLFHGSPYQLKQVCKHQSHDSDGNISNIDNAVFVTPSLLIASAYAFKDTIKEKSKELHWNFNVTTSKDTFPIMTMENVNLNDCDNIIGYIYVFENNNSFVNDPKDSLQYKSYQAQAPKKVLKIYYKDFSDYYEVIGQKTL